MPKIDRARARHKLCVVGGKRLQLFEQLAGVEGCRLLPDERVRAGERIANFVRASSPVASLKQANRFRQRALARNPSATPRYDFIRGRGRTPYFIYDNSKSPAALINVNRTGRNNCCIRTPSTITKHTKQLWITALDSRGITTGSELWCSYQKGSSHFDKIADDAIYAQHAHTRVWCGYRTPKQSWVQIEPEAQPLLHEPSTTPSHAPTTPERPRRGKRVQESSIPTGSPVLIPSQLVTNGGSVRQMQRGYILQRKTFKRTGRFFIVGYNPSDKVPHYICENIFCIRNLFRCMVWRYVCVFVQAFHGIHIVPI